MNANPNSHIERANAYAQAAGAVQFNAKAFETGEAWGRGAAELIGPLEHFRQELIDMTREAAELRKSFAQRFVADHGILMPRAFSRLRTLERDILLVPREVKWQDGWKNVVCIQGKNFVLDAGFAGSAYTAAWYEGLISISGYSATSTNDTMASHAGWTEATGYASATRPAMTFASASAGTKATSVATSYAINASDTIKGPFVASNSTKSGTTGSLWSAGLFSGGDKVVANTDTLNVTYTTGF